LCRARGVKVRVCPATGLFCTSSTVVVRAAVPPILIVVGLALSWIVVGAPATKVTVAVALKPPAEAVTVVVPKLVAATKLTVATPLASVVAIAVVAAAAKLPVVVVKLTGNPAGEPDATVTVARIATVLAPSATRLAAPALAVMPVAGELTTVSPTLSVIPFTVRTRTASGVFGGVGPVPA